MQTVKRLFRNSYDGENVVISADYADGGWVYEYEDMPKTINNTRYGNNALVIGNGVNRLLFDLNAVKKQQISAGNRRVLQTYGCNALYRDFAPDHLVVTGEISAEIAESGYCDQHVVYANGINVAKYPGKFHLVPQDPSWNAGAIAAYLACFDGHSRVYLMGFDGNDTADRNNNVYAGTNAYKDSTDDQNDTFWSLAMTHVFKTYPIVDFVLVNSSGRGYMPSQWQGYTNLRRIDFRQFVIECDL